MKTIKFVVLVLMLTTTAAAQSKKLKASVLNIDSRSINYDPQLMGNMVRTELEKIDTFQVMDRYDVNYVIEKNNLPVENCYGKLCLVEVGKTINADKIVTGSVEQFGENVLVTLRLIDIKSESIEKTQVNEFLGLLSELPLMVRLTLQQLLDKPYDATLFKNLSKKNNYESSVNNENKTIVKLGGPRSGFTAFTGKYADILRAPKSVGGYDAFPLMFTFGYQFEKQYLSEGDYQALFEFLPTVTGFVQNVFIPSVTLMNGFRNNKHGWEIAFGPTVSTIRKATGYYDSNKQWHLSSEWKPEPGVYDQNPYPQTERVDSRGDLRLNASFVVAIGKTFKSGRLNIPLNLYVIPGKGGWRFGLSLGFNAKRQR